MSERIYQIRVFCLLTGAVLPWSMIATGVGLTLAFGSPVLQMMAAWLVGIGFAVMLVATLGRWALNKVAGN
jgi:hypothetical protein